MLKIQALSELLKSEIKIGWFRWSQLNENDKKGTFRFSLGEQFDLRNISLSWYTTHSFIYIHTHKHTHIEKEKNTQIYKHTHSLCYTHHYKLTHTYKHNVITTFTILYTLSLLQKHIL